MFTINAAWVVRACCAVLLVAVFVQDEPPTEPPVPAPAPPAAKEPAAPERPLTPDERLRAEIASLLAELHSLRAELAKAQLESSQAQRELAELRQFIADHDTYGRDFEQYRAVREIVEREQRRRELEAARERREAEAAARLARQQAARAQRDRERSEAREVQRYRNAGFTALGLDVWMGPSSYHYSTREATPTPLRFDPIFGFYQDAGQQASIDYTSMTISGSVLNGTNAVRNIGIAVTFFDSRGSQVGHEIIQIDNARPDVPYPFTSTVRMALDRPFTSSSAYVLYADPISSN